MSDPASGEQSDSSARLLSLASSAIQPGREGAAGDPYFACAGAIEAELSRWPRAMAASRYELDRIASGCATAGSQWPTPAAIADLLAISPASSDAWPEPASRLLELARGGDSLALRALLLWSQAQTRPSLAAIATDSLIKRLFGAPGGRRFEALPPGLLAYATAAASSADPMTHRLLGQAAERQGSATALTSAFFHYGAAEAIYRAAGDDTEASLLRDWRIAVANRLSQEERAQAMARLEAWTPVVPAMKDRPAAGPDRLASDAATLDQLAESLGGGAELDLLKLHILRLRLALAPAADRMALAQRISALILSRDIWPAGANRDGGLAQLAEQAAEALPAADADQRLKLNLAIIRIFETDGAIIDFDQAGRPGDPTAIYRRALTSAVAAGRDRLAAVSGEFRFGTRAFSFRSVRYSYGPASVAAETALWLRLELAKALPDRPDVLAARAVTPFWIAVNLTDTQTQRDFLRGGDYDAVQRWYDDSLDQSFYGLADLERGGPLSHDDLAVLASAISWIANTIPNARIAEDIETFDLALRAVDRLEAQIEEGQPLPPWGRELSAHIDGLGLVATALSGLGADEPAFDADPPVSYRPMMQALGLAAQWEGLMLRGASTIADDDDLTQLPIPGTGIAIGFVAGRERNQPAKAAAAGDCERTASAYFDPERRAPAVSYDTVANDPVAVSNCLSAVQAAPEDPKLRFLLGRALNAEHAALGYAGDSPDAVRQFAAAAEAGYAAAFHNLAYIETDYQSSLLEGYVQRVLQTAFADAFKGFLTLPASDRDDSALFWFARRAADLGSPEANQILADLEPDPAERKFRLLIAARLWREARNPASEAAARDSAANIALAGEAEALVEAKAAAWTAEPLAELAPEMLTAIDGLGRP